MNNQIDRMLEQKAKEFAAKAHAGQKYNSHEYTYHLQAVANIAKELNLSEDIVAACWLHDTIEDCDVTYEDIEKEFGKKIADIVYAVTDGDGENRKERKANTYPKILANEDAIYVKLCDRIANLGQTIEDKNYGLLKMYLKEHDEFKNTLYNSEANEKIQMLWTRLDELETEGVSLQQSIHN